MITNLFLSVLENALSVTPIIVLLLLLSPFINKRYATKWSYLIWIFLALRLLIFFDAEEGWSAAEEMLSRGKGQTAVQTISQDGQDKGEGLPAGQIPGRVVLEIPAQITAPLAASEKSGATPLDVIAYAWAAGCAACLMVNIGCYLYHKRKVLQSGTVLKDRALYEQMFRIKRELKIRRHVTAVEFSKAGSPMLMGYLRPILIVNRNISDKSDNSEPFGGQELYFVLKHELVHYKRGDLYVKLLLMAVCALYWFHPLVWLMQKEAVVDMELSCDERVIKGMLPAQKKAYTETILSTLHKSGVRNTVLSTGFYEGKKVMKKRFRNILRKGRKKNGFYILACIALLTIGMGTLVGCSVTGEKAEAGEMIPSDEGQADLDGKDGAEEADGDTETGAEGAGNGAETGAGEAGNGAEIGAGEADNAAEISAADTITLTFMKEGMPEEKQAELVEETEYILYLPVGEWQKTEADMWQAMVNEDVRLWVAGFADSESAKRFLVNDGYQSTDEGMTKKAGGLCYQGRLYETENRAFCVYYCYPEVAEEGWGSELPVIADTFAVIVPGERNSEHDAADSTQVLGYISRFGDGTVTIDRQNWVTSEDPAWKPEYNADAGFEVVDAEGEDVTYPLASGCRYFVLEHHQGESMEIDETAFADYLRETDFPIFWAIEVVEGRVVSFAEWYRP